MKYRKGFKFTKESPDLTGYLVYKRNHYNGYDSVQGDSIDTAIALFIQWNISEKISYELPSENGKLVHRNCSFKFKPTISTNYSNQVFLSHEYSKRITLDFVFETQDLKLIEKTIPDDPYVHIPLTMLDRLDTVNNNPV